MRVQRRAAPILLAALWCSACAQVFAIDASNVLVLYNQASPDGIQIANYYAQVHPGVRLLGLTGVSTSEDISATQYLTTIRPQVMSALTSSTDVIVTTKGLPLRVNVTQSAPAAQWPNLPTYIAPGGQLQSIVSWKPTSSLESELASIDRISTWTMMGDQSYMIDGQFTNNPYYLSNSSFSHQTEGTRLTSRLDGYTTSDVLGSIDRAQNAFIGPNNSPNGPFHFLVDNDPTKNYATTMTSLVNNVLTPAGLPVTYNNTTAFVGTAPGPVIGYVSHGANQAATPANYIASGLNISLANGAVFDTWESYNASSFTPGGGHSSQGSVAQWLQKGGTAGVGNVAEPGASIANVVNEDQMFKMLLDGKTFAEAAWSATEQLSWVNTMVGDPLMTWKTLLAGDCNLDGRVDVNDLSLLAAHWGQTVPAGGYGWSVGDFNGDGVINNLDIAIMQADWGQVASWATEAPLFGRSFATAVPEPASYLLLALGMASLLAWRRGSRRRPS